MLQTKHKPPGCIHGARSLMLAVVTLAVSLCIAGVASFSPALLAKVEREFGIEAKHRMQSWQQLINTDRGKAKPDIIYSANRFFNRVHFVSDNTHWGRADYWATPVEFLATNGGDCEDFSIAKYFTLRELGVPDEQLRITYVKAAR
ncbi:MAG: transglutaminase-like cysteine peptidase, partial [Mariprofundaceae bacterium]|nr:transglutaminase-like cysteine peptidase [Mariprofundaceae bacterium]